MKEGFCEVFKGACAYGKRVVRNDIRRIGDEGTGTLSLLSLFDILLLR
jgi:hypothetical protein